MAESITMDVDVVCGVDLGDKTSWVCVLDREKGEVIEQAQIRTTPVGFRNRFSGGKRVRIAVEVGTHSPWVSELLEELGHDVVVANPRKVRLIGESRRKDDRIDAERLARLARVDPKLLSPVRHRGVEVRADLAVIKARDELVAVRTSLINHVRGTVKPFGVRIQSCSTHTFADRAMLSIPESLKPALEPVIEMISFLSKRIREYDRKIEEIVEVRYPEATHLKQIKGVGSLIALTFVLTLEDPERFRKSRSVGPFLGLVPALRASGDSNPQLRITKEGDPFLRKSLINGAHYILGAFGEDCDLRRYGLRIQQRGGKNAKKRAVVAVARKLAVLMHRLWITGEIYDPLYNKCQKGNPAA